jgi:N-acetylglucosamine kinase-like BadF-type ATPase
MKYVFAVDGGGTKTHLALFDLEGNLICDVILDGSNHQSLGGHFYQEVIKQGLNHCIHFAQIEAHQIVMSYFGLSGADLPSDYEKLRLSTKEVMKDIPFEIDNDAWIIFRSAVSRPYGAVAIAGTGTNSGAISQKGEKAILNSLGFMFGTYGGGLEIAREAMHYAFRAKELTYKDTLLRTEIPKLFNCSDLDEVISLFYPKMMVSRSEFGKITALVNTLANQGDEISKEILYKNGYTIGLQTNGPIKQLGMQHETFPVVYGGRVFQGDSPILLDAFKKAVTSECSHVYFVEPTYPPVYGAYLYALDRLGIPQNDTINKNLKKRCENDEKRD